MHLHCPCCSAHMLRMVGQIYVRYGMYEPTRVRQAEYVACTACAVASEVDPRNGALMDLGAVTLQDLLEPVEEPITLVIAAPACLQGRSDS